jgi:hypothetical protein
VSRIEIDSPFINLGEMGFILAAPDVGQRNVDRSHRHLRRRSAGRANRN